MDLASIIGLVGAVSVLLYSILLAGDLKSFWDTPSVICVIGGVIAVTFTKWPLEIVLSTGKFFMKGIFYPKVNAKDTIIQLTQLAETARRESVFALEKVPIEDPYLKKAMTLAADNRPPEVIQSILQLEIDALSERHKQGISVLDGIAVDGPAMGMLGTLIGLVIMLGNMSDPAAIGPAMAVAILTTFYGAVVANVFAGPIKNKIEFKSKGEQVKMNIIIAGTLGIVAGENPRLIKEKLNSFLAPNERIVDEDAGGGGAAPDGEKK